MILQWYQNDIERYPIFARRPSLAHATGRSPRGRAKAVKVGPGKCNSF
jgi:hypothetical protein